MLLEAGANPSCHNGRGESPLQWAAWSGSRELVELLLSHGADIHAQDTHPSFGWSALHCAAHQAMLSRHLKPSHMRISSAVPLQQQDEIRAVSESYPSIEGTGRMHVLSATHQTFGPQPRTCLFGGSQHSNGFV